MKLNRIAKRIIKNYSNYSWGKKFKAKIKELLSYTETPELSADQKKKVKKYYDGIGVSVSGYGWHQLCTGLYGEFSEKYVPEDFYYIDLEPFLNRMDMIPALLDKNLLSKLFDRVEQPKTILKNINHSFATSDDVIIGLEEAMDLLLDHQEFIIKPSIQSGGGRKVAHHDLNNIGSESKKKDLIRNLFSTYKKDYIVQNVVGQNATMKKLNPTSINTIRVMSYLDDKEVKILSSYVRMGAKDSYADNVHAGGLFCGVKDNGTLHKYGMNEHLKPFEKNHNDVIFKDFTIPYYREIREKVKELHQFVPYFKLVSWDMALDEKDRIVLIEYNLKYQEVNAHQIINGPVLEPALDYYRTKVT